MVLAGMAALDLLEPGPDAGFHLWQPLRRRVELRHEDEGVELKVRVLGPDTQLWTVEDRDVEAWRTQGRWRIDGKPASEVVVAGGVATVFDGYGLAFDIVDPLDRATGAQGDGNLIEAPMPGLVRAVEAEVGQKVSKGDRLAVLEAMKMEHSLLAARDGIIAEVLAAPGDQVEAGAALVRLEAEAEDAA